MPHHFIYEISTRKENSQSFQYLEIDLMEVHYFIFLVCQPCFLPTGHHKNLQLQSEYLPIYWIIHISNVQHHPNILIFHIFHRTGSSRSLSFLLLQKIDFGSKKNFPYHPVKNLQNLTHFAV